jgi:hypothetical protein
MIHIYRIPGYNAPFTPKQFEAATTCGAGTAYPSD